MPAASAVAGRPSTPAARARSSPSPRRSRAKRHAIGINCNCVAPGPTATPLFLEATAEKLQEALANAIPFKRVARPSEIGQTILFFSSPAADYITGQVLSVSGGLTMHG